MLPMYPHILMLGFLGSGKGTQVEIIKKKFGFSSISSGCLFREEVRIGTELGLLAKKHVIQGISTPNEETIKLIESKLLFEYGSAIGLLFDGYPANLVQAKSLDSLLNKSGKKIDIVIKLVVDEAVINERLKHRMVCSKCDAIYNNKFHKPIVEGVCNYDLNTLIRRDDDVENLVSIRLGNQKITQPQLLTHYSNNKAVIMEIDGDQSIQDVNSDITTFLQSF